MPKRLQTVVTLTCCRWYFSKPKHHVYVFSFKIVNFWKGFCSIHWAEVSLGQELPVGDRVKPNKPVPSIHPASEQGLHPISSCQEWGEAACRRRTLSLRLCSGQSRFGSGSGSSATRHVEHSQTSSLQASEKQPDRIFSWTAQHLNGPVNQKHLPTAMTSCCLLTLATSITPFTAPLL